MHSTDRPAFRPDIEGVRGLAILLVVLFHAGVPGLRGAFVAVDVFFVVSGFFLTGALVREIAADGRVDLTAFYARRMLRLLPVLLLVLIATLGTVLLYAPIDRATAAGHVPAAAFFGSNVALAAEGVNYFSSSENPLLHTWSLGVEQQFHLMWPLVLLSAAWLATRRRVRVAVDGSVVEGVRSDETRRAAVRGMLIGIAVAGTTSFLVSLYVSGVSPTWSYFGPHTRLWEFAVGGAAAMITGSRSGVFGENRRAIAIAQAVGLALIALATVFYERTMPYPGAAALVPAIGATLLLVGGSPAADTALGRTLAATPLQWLGRVSYAWYLWHWPLMVLGAQLDPTIGASGRTLLGGVALVLAWLTNRFLERPARYGTLTTRSRYVVFIGATLASTAVALLAIGLASHAERMVQGSVQRVFAAARGDRMEHSCWVRSVDRLPRGDCSFGDPRGPVRIALLGDSHAEHWLGGLDRAGRAFGWRIEANVMGGCPVADFSGMLQGVTSRRYRECTRYREATLQRVIAERPDAVLLSSYDHYMPAPGRDADDWSVSRDVWQRGLQRTYQRLAAAGITTIVMRGTPRTPFDVPACLSRRAAGLPLARACTYTLDRAFIAEARRAQDSAARGLPVRFIDMNDMVCATSPCPTVTRGIVMFTDDNHLTASFTRSLAPVLGARMQGMLRDR